MSNIDIPRLRALLAGATPGPRVAREIKGKWHVRTACCIDAPISLHSWGPNAIADAALHNAAPAMLDELEALRARVREAESWAQRDDSLASYAFQQYGDDARLYNGVHALEAENGKLRALVAELEREGSDVND